MAKNLRDLRTVGLNCVHNGYDVKKIRHENCDAPKSVAKSPSPPSTWTQEQQPRHASSSASCPSKASAATASDTIKILMVHGAVQNSKIFQTRTSNLRAKALKVAGKGKLEFVWAESPLNVHPALASEENADIDGRAWYTPHEISQGNVVRPVESKKYDDWEQPMEALRTLAKQEGPFAGLIAFSQGGVPASLLLAEMKDSLNFAIFVSCFGPQDSDVCARLAQAKQEPIDVPTMHVMGKTDPFVANYRSEELAGYFKDPSVISHDGGHIMIPKELFGNVKDFLAQVMK